MMTSLVLLVPIVVSVTAAASLQQILDDRLISRSKDTFTVSPEMELDSIKMDSRRRSSRRHPTKINEDAKETKTSQFLLPDGISENRLLSTTTRTLTDSGLSTLKKVVRRPFTTIKTQSDVNESQNDVNKSENDVSNAQKDRDKSTNVNKSQNESENDVNNLQMETNKSVNDLQRNVQVAQNATKNTSRNVKSTTRNVKNGARNVKTIQSNVKNNVKTTPNNVQKENIDKVAPSNVKIAKNNLKGGENIVKTATNSVKIAQNVKSGENIKTTPNNVKSVQKNTNVENSQKFDNISKSKSNVKNNKAAEHPSQTSTSTGEKSTSKVKTSILENESSVTDMRSKLGKRNRKNKGFFFSYPYVPQIRHHYPHYDSNFEDCNYSVAEERTPGGKKKYQDSNIYYIKLPPTPYMFVPGLGYVSQPPRYSPPPLNPPMAHVRPFRPARPPTIYQPHVNPFIKVPIDFISNGKPTSVYQWQDGKLPSRPENQITNLDKGPYTFNGRPSSIYLLRPDGSQTIPQPIRLNDYQNNGYYSSATFD